MPYEVSFRRDIGSVDRGSYINECCIGGDVVSAQLLPSVQKQFEDVQAEQEDWGWFIWFRKGPIHLSIDIFCDDPQSGLFRIHLASRKRRLLLGNQVVDTEELEQVKELVVSSLRRWEAAEIQVERLDAKFMPLK